MWGLYHGGGLVLHRAWGATGLRARMTAMLPPLAYRALALIVTFHFVTFGWVLFRSPDFATVGAVFTRLAQGFTGVASFHVDEAVVFKTYGFTAMLLYGLVILIARLGRVRAAIAERFELRAMLWGLMLYLTLLLAPVSTDPFIYFQF
jgi:D-alanyl-lipoteichoic acid acyltransferase DltB (MBOAT superfamily)